MEASYQEDPREPKVDRSSGWGPVADASFAHRPVLKDGRPLLRGGPQEPIGLRSQNEAIWNSSYLASPR